MANRDEIANPPSNIASMFACFYSSGDEVSQYDGVTLPHVVLDNISGKTPDVHKPDLSIREVRIGKVKNGHIGVELWLQYHKDSKKKVRQLGAAPLDERTGQLSITPQRVVIY